MEVRLHLPAKTKQSAIGHREDWLPDEGVWRYVSDMLEKRFGVDVGSCPRHWIPLTIVGTLDWLVICGWWTYRYTGLYKPTEHYDYIFDWGGCEWDPTKLVVFRDIPENNKFEERLRSPGLEGRELNECVPFLSADVFELWWEHHHNKTPEEAERFFPPLDFIKYTMYATFMWVLDEYGRPWISAQDEVFGYTFKHGVAYQSLWDNAILDHNYMVETNRKKGTCRYCEQTLHCVNGTTVDVNWQNVCDNCLIQLVMQGTPGLDEHEPRIREPKCPHLTGLGGSRGTCNSVCPHSGMTEEKVWEELERKGAERLRLYRERVRNELGGVHPRQAAGQTLDDIVGHFRPQIEDR